MDVIQHFFEDFTFYKSVLCNREKRHNGVLWRKTLFKSSPLHAFQTSLLFSFFFFPFSPFSFSLPIQYFIFFARSRKRCGVTELLLRLQYNSRNDRVLKIGQACQRWDSHLKTLFFQLSSDHWKLEASIFFDYR